MTEHLRVAILSLDPGISAGDIATQATDIFEALPEHTAITIVGPVGVDGYAHRPVDIAAGNARRPSGPLAPLIRVVNGNVRGRRAWRELRADANAMKILRTADLVVVVDPLANRAGWVLAKKHGVHAVTGLRAVRYVANRTATK